MDDKMSFFFFATRLTLVKHVLSSIPHHISSVIPLPSRTCLQIERLMRNSLWSADSIKSRSNFVRWKKICLPKCCDLGPRRKDQPRSRDTEIYVVRLLAYVHRKMGEFTMQYEEVYIIETLSLYL